MNNQRSEQAGKADVMACSGLSRARVALARFGLALIVAWSQGGLAQAQSYLLESQSLVVSGGHAESTSFRAWSCIGFAPSGLATSASYSMVAGCSAALVLMTFTVSPSAGANGTITPDTLQPVEHGLTVSFTVSPDPNYTASVGGTCGGTLVGDLYTTEPITADCTVEAEFELLRWPLTVTLAGAGSGTVTSDPPGIDCPGACSAEYDHGTVVTLSAQADGFSAFVGWSGEGCSGTADCVVTMSQAREVTATFTDVAQIALLADPPEGGSVTGAGEFQIGHPATVVAWPNFGWAFLEWREGGVPVSSSPMYTFTLTGDIELTAAFQERPVEAIPVSGTVGLVLLMVLVTGIGAAILRRM